MVVYETEKLVVTYDSRDRYFDGNYFTFKYLGGTISKLEAEQICLKRIELIDEYKCGLIFCINKSGTDFKESREYFKTEMGYKGITRSCILVNSPIIAYLSNLFSPKNKEEGKPIIKVFSNYSKAKEWLLRK
jgi:hypothetical protein